MYRIVVKVLFFCLLLGVGVVLLSMSTWGVGGLSKDVTQGLEKQRCLAELKIEKLTKKRASKECDKYRSLK